MEFKTKSIKNDVKIRAYEYYIALETSKLLSGMFVSKQHKNACIARLDIAQHELKELIR